MKRNDIERLERELKRKNKHEDRNSRREGSSAGQYIKDLAELFRFDDNHIYNALDDEDILELLMDMKEDLPEKQWSVVLKRAIKKTNVTERDLAFSQLQSLIADA